MEKKYVVSGIVVLVVLIAGFLAIKNGSNQSSQTSQSLPVTESPQKSAADNSAATTTGEAGQGQAIKNSAAVVVYTEQGFIPETVTVKKGEAVTFKNKSGRDMWVASNPHPTHTLYPEKLPSDCLGSSFDACKGVPAGADWSYTFNSVGTWRYHDHLRPDNQGTVVVQ